VPELSAEQRRQLEALRVAYEAELPGKITAIARAAAALGSGAGETDLRDLHRLVHRLAGSSAIWGFTELSRKAGELEHVVLSWMDRAGVAAADAAAPGLDGQVHRLVEELERSMPPPARPPRRARRRRARD
jgi:HPt (histidine-containing phosphotransfer) domain-containing protein